MAQIKFSTSSVLANNKLLLSISIHYKNNAIGFVVAFQYHLDTGFHYKSIRKFDGHAKLQTPFHGMENSETALNVSFAEDTAYITGKVLLYPMDLKVYSTAVNDVLNVTADVTFNHRR